MIKVNLETQKQIERSLSEYKTECDKLNCLLTSNDGQIMAQKVQTAEKEQQSVFKLNSAKQLEAKSEAVRALLRSHKVLFQDFKKKIMGQLEIMEEKYAMIFQESFEDCDEEDVKSVHSGSNSNNNKQLSKSATDTEHQSLSGFDRPQALHQSASHENESECNTDDSTSPMRTEDTEVRLERQRKLVGVTQSKIGDAEKNIKRACYNTYTREIFVLEISDSILVFGLNETSGKFEKTRDMKWKELRGDKDELRDFTLDKINDLYLSIRSKENDFQNRVEIVSSKNMQKIMTIDTDGIINGEDIRWLLYAKNENVLLAVHDCRISGDQVSLFDCLPQSNQTSYYSNQYYVQQPP